MDSDWDDLAARFRTAAQARRQAEAAEEAARQARLEAARAARTALLDDLAAFGEAAGIEVVRTDDEGCLWALSERSVRFSPQGSGERVAVTWQERTPKEARLYREAELGDRWVLAVSGLQVEDRMPLMEAGLVRLMVHGLGLDAPVEDASPARRARPSQEVSSGPGKRSL